MDWIGQNKEWIFSGAGIFIITSVTSIIAAIITLWLKAKSERNKRKRLSFGTSIKEYRIPGVASDEQLKITYKTKHYEDLCQYSIDIKNTGQIAIDGQQVLVYIPKAIKVVDFLKSFSTGQITSQKNMIETKDFNEHRFDLNRIEPRDEAKFTIILDSKNPSDIKSEPRGVDDIDYTFGKSEDASDVNRLIMFAALFAVAGVIPLVGDAFRAMVILLSAPTILRIVKSWNFDNNISRTVVIHELNTGNASDIRIDTR